MPAAFAPEGIALALAALLAIAVLSVASRWRLRQIEARRLQSVAQAYAAVPVPIVLIARDDGSVLQMNAALLDLFGATAPDSEALRRQIASLGPALAGVAEPPASAPGAAIELEHRFERADGQVFWAMVRAKRDPLAVRAAWLCTLTDMTALQQARDRLSEIATTDALTAVLNRKTLEQRLRIECQRAERDRTALSLLRIDVEQLARVEEGHGRETADLALAMVAATCSEALRPTDLLGRWGAVSFLAVLPSASAIAAADVAERLRQRVEALAVPVHRADGSVRITTQVGLSVGCVTVGGEGALPTLGALLQAAEVALASTRTGARSSRH